MLGINQNKFKEYLSLTLSDTVVNIFKEYLYKVKFYDVDNKCIVNIKGVVTDFYGSKANPSLHMLYKKEDIDIKYPNNNSCNTNKPICNFTCKYYKYCFTINGKKTTSNCPMTVNQANKEQYDTIGTITIPVANIYSIECCKFKSPTHIIEDDLKKEEVKILLLGISAKQLRTIIINMQFIDDQMDNAFKEINLKIGNRYKIVYNKKENPINTGCDCGNIYELEGVLTKIEELPNCSMNPDYSNSIVRTINCDHPEEIVGLHNSIYVADDVSTDKDKFLTADPIKSDFRLTFDTTDRIMNSTFDAIYLSQIRDVDLITDNGTCDCGCNSTLVVNQPKKEFMINNIKYIYDDGYIYEYKKEGTCPKKYILEQILNFYFEE